MRKTAATLSPLVLALLAAGQWLVWRMAGPAAGAPWDALAPGLCIVGAAFLMTWAAEAVEADLPRSLAVGILALLAVLPEYAVDMHFAWKAAHEPAYAAYAAANMTGANRMLIGVGWPCVLLVAWRRRGAVSVGLGDHGGPELTILLAATLYSFILPFKATISVWDAAVFLGLFGYYAWRASGEAAEEPETEGVARLIAELPAARRRAAVAALFVFAGAAIAAAAEPFAEGVLSLGGRLGIEKFLLVQWLAPLASEAPEFVVAMIFAFKGKASVGLRALVSSKVNQWTLLVGMLPIVYSLSSGQVAALPLDARQVEELFLTSAQSLFATLLLMDRRLSLREASALLGLFGAQVFFPQAAARWAFAGVYLALAAGLAVLRRARRV